MLNLMFTNYENEHGCRPSVADIAFMICVALETLEANFIYLRGSYNIAFKENSVARKLAVVPVIYSPSTPLIQIAIVRGTWMNKLEKERLPRTEMLGKVMAPDLGDHDSEWKSLLLALHKSLECSHTRHVKN